MPGYHAGRPPRNKGRVYPADPPTVEEIVAVMREASDDRHGYRLRALIVVLWRGGLRVAEALALGERDLDSRRGSLLVRNGKGGRRREIGMDAWGWDQMDPWLAAREQRRCPHRAPQDLQLGLPSPATALASTRASPRRVAPARSGRNVSAAGVRPVPRIASCIVGSIAAEIPGSGGC